MRRALLLAVVTTLAGCSSRPAPAVTREGRAPAPTPVAATPATLAPRPPVADSVVLITVDTLRADALGVHDGLAETPALDRLARTGWDFTRCFSASMLTNPSHASIMTSLYPRDHGVYDNESGVRADARTLALALSRHGMRTVAVIGFPHLNPEVSGLGAGFDKVVRAERTERRASDTTRAALTALDESAPTGPFFLWVHYTDPHAPYEPPADVAVPALPMSTPMAVAARAAPGFQRHNPWFQSVFRRERFAEALAARYLGEVSAADRAVGDLITGLTDRGRMGRTAVVVTSDHGEQFGEHRLWFHHGSLYNESVQVPLIVRAPGQTPARVDGLTATVDIAPTVLELVGAPRWEPMRGASLVDVARGLTPARSVVFSEHINGELASLRSPEATLIVHRKSSSQYPTYDLVAGKIEYYETREDPGEQRPLRPDGAGARALEAQLWRLVGRGGEPVARRASLQSNRESLRALGYIE